MSKKIPRKEVELAALADVIIGGLKANPQIFENPPLTIEKLEESTTNVNLAIDNVAQNKGRYEAAVEAKNLNVATLRENVTEIAEYCYKVTKENKALLAMVGLSPRAKNQPVEIPGRCRDFETVKQGIDSVEFKWIQPKEGGKVRAYIIQSKTTEAPPEAWATIWTAIGKKAEIKEQPQNVILDYRVRGLNVSGLGPPSNAVTLKF